MSPTRKGRGYRTQDVVRDWYRARGWPDAEDAPASTSGVDITKMLGLAPEVKARRAFEPMKWLRQAARNAAGAHPFVVFRCDGQGETTVGEWGVLMTLEAHTQLLHEAGYGTPLTVTVFTPEEAMADRLSMPGPRGHEKMTRPGASTPLDPAGLPAAWAQVYDPPMLP